MAGTASRTARVSTARWNLKEAAGKLPARRTEIAYEAVPSGREGQRLQSPIAIREDGAVYAAGMWEEGHAHYPGRSADLPRATGAERRRDGSAEVSRQKRQKGQRQGKRVRPPRWQVQEPVISTNHHPSDTKSPQPPGRGLF
jgi:hypothetical protein